VPDGLPGVDIVNSYDVDIVKCGSPLHLADLGILRARGLAIPHDYSAWPLHVTSGSWIWCRVIDRSGALATGFAIELSASRAIPGFRIGRVDRIGRELHANIADAVGEVLRTAAGKIPRLLRLNVRVFDEDALRRQRVSRSLEAAGWIHSEHRRAYTRTLVLKLDGTKGEVIKALSRRVRNTIDDALASQSVRFAPIAGSQYADRIRYLHALSFARNGTVPPRIDARGILGDSLDGTSSLLIGAFVRDGKAPDDLVAFAWARLHGDHAVLEINASDRSHPVSDLSPGFALVSHLIGWAIEHGATWIDLGGLSSLEPAADDPLRGVIEFKKRFSTDLREIADEWTFEPNAFLASLSSAIGSIARFPPFRRLRARVRLAGLVSQRRG
jgi:hypothetical protein